MYDVIVIGAGPAGLSAGIYSGRSRLSTLIIEKSKAGGQAAITSEIENYPGGDAEETGPSLIAKMVKQAERFGVERVADEITGVDFSGPEKKLTGRKGEYSGKTVIVASGAFPRPIGCPGEQEFTGKGVSYCATCDADFFEELDVAVIGSGDSAIEEALYLTKFAESVAIIVIHDEGVLDCNRRSAEKALAHPKLKWVWNATLEEIVGDEMVESAIVKNIRTGERQTLDVNGVFVFVGMQPKTEFLKGKIELDQWGYIPTSDKMETNIPGVYAVGDVRAKYLRQVVTAAADGAIAAVAAEKFLEGHVEGRLTREDIAKLTQ